MHRELLLDLYEGDPLHDQIVDDVLPRLDAAVLVDPAGAERDWCDASLRRIATPLALIEHRGSRMARRADVVFSDAAARASAFGLSEARHASGCPVEASPPEFCRSEFVLDVTRTLWRVATQSRLRTEPA